MPCRPAHCRPARGNALVFTMLGLVVGGMVLALGMTYYQTSQASAQIQASVSEVGAIVGSAQQNYGQYGYSGLTTAVAVGSRVIPESRANSDGKTATDAFSGALTLEDNSATTPDTARLSYSEVPAPVCSQIVNGASALARQVMVAGAEVKPLDGSLNVGKVVTQCTSGASVTIEFVFGRS